MTYYSEYGQDRWLVENVFGGARNGVFVEAGALDGVFHSNTLHFEREKNWHGVLIEPIPELCKKVRENRFRSTIFNCAIGAQPRTDVFEISTVAGWSGLSRHPHPRRAGTARTEIVVTVRPLGSVLMEAAIDRVDYLSLDVEGAELEVFLRYPFDEIPIRVIGVEDNGGNNVALRELLACKSYRHLARVGVDEFWSL